MPGSRTGAFERGLAYFDGGAFEDDLRRRVAIASVSQEPERLDQLHRYLDEEISASLAVLGYDVETYDNPVPDHGPILVARRIEDPDLPTVLGYGHGDVVRGLDEDWREGLSPWSTVREGDRLYGRGTADNKGQHSINIGALASVLAERGGLGFNSTFLLEMSEERGSRGLGEFCDEHRDLLRADVLIASDGPRLSPDRPDLTLGGRGAFHFRLEVDLRDEWHHSGHWGGVLEDPGVILANALAAIIDGRGQILIPEWLPRSIPPAVHAALQDCAVAGGEAAPEVDPEWGQPGLTQAEKILAWTGFIVLAFQAGNPDNPVNAVPPKASAACQIRHTVDVDPARFEPALRRHLDERGFSSVRIETQAWRSRPASRTDPDNPWVGWAAESMRRSSGAPPRVVPNLSGGLPSDIFADLGMPTLWVPHSYNGYLQHGPNEHLLLPIAREGLALMTGLFWDLGEEGAPKSLHQKVEVDARQP